MLVGSVRSEVGPEVVREMNKPFDDAETSLRISLVIPVRDEAATIQALLASIAVQTRRPDEVVFVDGGSRDQTVALLRQAATRDSSIQVIEAGEATPGRGRNIGIAAATHDWIALTDAGIRLEPQWLQRLAEAAERNPELEVVFGNYEPEIDHFIARCGSLLYVQRRIKRPTGWMRGPFIASSLIRRSVWKRLGGFPDLRATEDTIFMERVLAEDCRVSWSPEAVVWWQPPRTLAATWRRFVVFSRINVWAGRQRYWHYGMARFYLASLVFVLLGFIHSWWWLCVPVAAALARVAKNIWERRGERGLWWALNPAQFLGVAAILGLIDVATTVGWIQALWRKPQPVSAEVS